MKKERKTGPQLVETGLRKHFAKYLIPFTQIWIDGKPDFRAIDAVKSLQSIEQSLCAILGIKLAHTRNRAVLLLFMLVLILTASAPEDYDLAVHAFKKCSCQRMVRLSNGRT